jgi:hypothetical protein
LGAVASHRVLGDGTKGPAVPEPLLYNPQFVFIEYTLERDEQATEFASLKIAIRAGLRAAAGASEHPDTKLVVGAAATVYSGRIAPLFPPKLWNADALNPARLVVAIVGVRSLESKGESGAAALHELLVALLPGERFGAVGIAP